MYLVDMLKCENLGYATNFKKVIVLDLQLSRFNDFGGHIGGHLEFQDENLVDKS